MSHKDDPRRFKKGREFIDYAVKEGCELRQGNHPFVRASNGVGCPIPNHPGDLPTGTRRSILRSFVAMGIFVAVGLLVVGLVIL